MIKQGRRSRDGAQPADLLVCFPSHRTNHLNLIPSKPICSPGHPTDITKVPHRRSHHHHLRGGHSMSSPHLWAKTKPSMRSQIKEPTSPKVSCAGNIKVIRQPKSITNTTTTTPRATTTTMMAMNGKYRSSSSKNWHSVMEEIEMTRKKSTALEKTSIRATTNTRSTSWMGSTLGKKKDVMKFLKNLRNFRLNFGCLGSFEDVSHQDNRSSSSTTTTSAEEDEVVIQEDNKRYEFCRSRHSTGSIRNGENSYRTNVMSKVYTALQEKNNVAHAMNTNNAVIDIEKIVEDHEDGDMRYGFGDGEDAEELCAPAVPPPNALLLMRCKTLPAKSWLEERDQSQQEEEMMKKQGLIMKWENQNTTNTDSCKISSSNIVKKKTWVIDGIKDQFSRSRSWKI
ncbi:uncharacterized protein LOC113285404 [Papaver somniferum]|uniref:uncharacterized protein LOC113285404 n=1 Tax=Papaver somniferum TaxID=3469 RepID=UPI000E6F7D73|nr:uncharacterized protein LOC113285404 [Papaver somniferum]